MNKPQGDKVDPQPDEGSPQKKGESPAGPSPDSEPEEAGDTRSSEEKPGKSEESPGGDDLSVYPLRDPSEDARWAIRTVRIWIGFALAAIVFILTLLVLGAIYD